MENTLKNRMLRGVLLAGIIVALLIAFVPQHITLFDKEITIGFQGTAEAATADYVCDGTSDNVQWQAALNALPSGGGKLVALAGNYDFDNTVSRAIDNVTIEGVGYASYFANNGSTALFSAGSQDKWVFRDLRTDAGSITVTSATHFVMENVWLGSDYYTYRADSDIDASSVEIPTGRSATLIVAASDSSDGSIAQADYVCDGTSDNVEIQAAIDALPSVGGKVQLMEGTFYIAAAIEITDDNVCLRGLGRRTTILKLAANDNVVEVISATDSNLMGIELRDFEIDGTRASYTGKGIVIQTFARSVIANLHISEMGDDAIYCMNQGTGRGTACIFENLYITSCDDDGIVCDTTPYESFFLNITIRVVGGYQIRFIGTPRQHLSQCHFGGTNGGNAIMKMEEDVDNFIITGCWFNSQASTPSHGIHIDPIDDAVTQVAITGCNFSGGSTSGHDGIFLDVSGSGHLYYTNIVGNNFLNWQYGVNINHANVIRALVEANIFYNNGTDAPRDQGTSDLIVDNIVS